MELLLNGNMYLLYFVVLLFFLKPDKLEDNQKIFIVYVISFFVDCTNTISSLYIIVVSTICMFFNLEYFDDSEFKVVVMQKFRYRLADFNYLMIFQYCYFSYIIIMILNTSFIYNFIHKFETFKDISPVILSGFLFLILLALANPLYSLKWKIKSLDDIKKKMHGITTINNLDVDMVKEKEDIVTLLEDKSFLKRKKYGTIFSIDYLKNYAIPRTKDHFKNIVSRSFNKVRSIHIQKFNIISLPKIAICKIVNGIMAIAIGVVKTIIKVYNSIKRGHSTIEAQIIRTIGIERGYHKGFLYILKRKIFELIYTNICFNSLKEFYDQNHYANAIYMKEYLLYIYLLTAKIVIKGNTYNGVEDLYKKELKDITTDELFIAVLSMSKYNLIPSQIYRQSMIYQYAISMESIENIFNKI